MKAASEYVRRLVSQGMRVAICEQVEDPKLAKGIVKRAVIETITPGAVLADDLLDGSRNNYICALYAADGPDGIIGVAAADVSTGELRLATLPRAALEPLLARLSPREIVLAAGMPPLRPAARLGSEGPLVTERDVIRLARVW